jgi:ATP-dependent DNA helicase RecG
LNRINWRVEIGSRKRNEIPEIPEKALREIIVNAFAHANYEVLPEIEIGIHPNGIEIYNPGSFPDELTPFDFISKNLPSYKRNKLILDVLFRSKDVEKSGTGFQRVNYLCNNQGVSWTYKKEAYGFSFVFIRSNVQLNVQLKEDLTAQEQTIFNLINDNAKISKGELALRIGKSEKTVQRAISSLMKKEVIARVGSNKTGYWKANEKE